MISVISSSTTNSFHFLQPTGGDELLFAELFLTPLCSMWGFAIGATCQSPGPVATFFKSFPAIINILLMIAITAAANFLEIDLLVHVPIILLIVISGLVQIKTTRGTSIIFGKSWPIASSTALKFDRPGVLLMAISQDVSKLEFFRQLGYSPVDVLHLFLSAGLLLLAIGASFSPPATSKKEN